VTGRCPPPVWRYGSLPSCKSGLRLEEIPPGHQHPLHQGTYAQLSGVGQGFVQQGHGLSRVVKTLETTLTTALTT
jgi:hypothetical protein